MRCPHCNAKITEFVNRAVASRAGSVSSARKTKACRENGRKGGKAAGEAISSRTLYRRVKSGVYTASILVSRGNGVAKVRVTLPTGLEMVIPVRETGSRLTLP